MAVFAAALVAVLLALLPGPSAAALVRHRADPHPPARAAVAAAPVVVQDLRLPRPHAATRAATAGHRPHHPAKRRARPAVVRAVPVVHPPRPVPAAHARSMRPAPTVRPNRATVRPRATAAAPPASLARGTSQLITVLASSWGSTTATLQRWERAARGWVRVGAPILAHLGAAGLTAHPSEATAATPVGVFAFGLALGQPAGGVTRMPYRQLRPGDGWNGDPFSQGYDRLARTGEMWRGRFGWARYAILIDTNPKRIGGARNRGSGVFLHSDPSGQPTAACVGLAPQDVRTVLGWLDPSARPRIEIAVGRLGRP